MPRLFNSLRGQLVLLIVAALVVAQAVSLWLFVDERGLAVRAALGLEAADRAANVVRLIEEAPKSLQPAILRAANSALVRFELSDTASVTHANHADGGRIESRLRDLLGTPKDREIRVELHKVERSALPMPHSAPEMAQMHANMMHGKLSAIEMQLSIALPNREWLNVGTRFQNTPLQWPWVSILSFAVTAAIILVSVCWYLLSRLTGPLLNVSLAADRLGRGENVKALPVRGPSEVRDLTEIFNRMQERLTRFVADRTQLLAALGHDLRSPLTALRVRAEMVEEDESRISLIASIEEMQEMVEATLSFARGVAVSEAYETQDLGTFLRQLQEDMLDAFELSKSGQVTLRLRPKALRRALRNVIDNALRYGGNATVSFGTDENNAFISVADDGPGIPEAELEHVFEPFVRLEKSRSRETGGTGLGLSIARTLVRAHGGDLILSNGNNQGLVARIVLPLADNPEVDPTRGS